MAISDCYFPFCILSAANQPENQDRAAEEAGFKFPSFMVSSLPGGTKMATTRRTRIKDVERADAELAALRDQRARIDARIEALESTRKADLLKLASDILHGLDLSHVPVLTIIARLSALDGVAESSEGVDTARVEEVEKVETFIRFTRNAGSRKRALLERCGLHWHGRDAGWTGVVGSATLAQLRDVFGDKVEKPPLIAPGGASLCAQESDASPLCADEEHDGGASEVDAEVAGTANGDETTDAAGPVLTKAFRGFPPRRPAPQEADKPA
ncbi:hypothetical protein AB8Z38_13385 [Bradyrhizobium sp. LLZ17]|uniref:Uncharacterized protein n=1 Tax=Bradyrhizobium sp. LLZ17 TaxID=3239388 RepID=A0AB39XQW9_9BRAD